MVSKDELAQPDQATLLDIIAMQTEIAKAGLDLGDVMALVTEHAQRLTRASGAVIELAEDEDMVYRAASGIAARQLGLRLKRSSSLSGMCVEQRAILLCTDSEIDDRVDREACRRVGLRSMLTVPLNHLDTTVGALKVMSAEVAAFGQADIRVLSLISDLVAAAMYHAAQHAASDLYYRATHDALTEIANRASFYDQLRQSIARADRQSERLGVLNLDMDGLKPINDAHGHHAGDAALKELASRISSACRQTDVVARVGGDEFGVILTPIDDHHSAHRLRDRFQEAIEKPLPFGEHELAMGASIGLAIYPDDACELNELLAKADAAMYAVKRDRKNRR